MKTLMKKTVLSVIISLTASSMFAQMPPREWKVTLKVVDETGQPVANAETWVGYMSTNKITGLTDSNGVFVASHSDRSFGLVFHADKIGYYSFRKEYELGFPSQYNKTKWNPTEIIVLRKIGNPIPMYAQQARIEVPEIDKPVGFDLIEGDWVAPYGRGKQSDFIFQGQRRFVSWQDFDSSFKLTFPDPGDGLVPINMPLDQGNVLRLPALAPENAYVPQLSQQLGDTPAKGWEKSEKKDQNYYFRVRTVRDENGNIKSALYGKIYGDFEIDAINSKTLLIFFQYYLNPMPNSRNVEFDTKHNLFKYLSDRQQVAVP